MNIYLEIFGYIGTLLIIISMMMSSVKRLRVINVCGSLISAIYSAISAAYPIVLLNIALIAVNIFKLCCDERAKAKLTAGAQIQNKINKDESEL